MEQERQEVYERIPWETLEKKGSDRQWMVYAIAGAVVLGALAYSFMRNQSTAPPPTVEATPTTVPAITTTSNMGATPSTVTSPVVVAEADLYAVDPERLIDQAAAHAEWFAVEYIGVDGSEQSSETLGALLPEGIPLPEPQAGTQVYVDWVRARSVSQTGPLSFEVEVLVRSLVSTGEEGFLRQSPQLVDVAVEIGEDGEARIAGVPSVGVAIPAPSAELSLSELPENVEAPDGDVIGGIEGLDGEWDVVVMAEGPDGVRRPVILEP